MSSGADPKDFHVFGDGVEQKIQSLTFGLSENGLWDVRDNFGHHYIDFYAPMGKWTFPEESPGRTFTAYEVLPTYRLTYAPPKSPEGFCHRINVTVDRWDALVSARKSYCSFEREASDLLRGTKFGKQLENVVTSHDSGSIPLFATASVFRNGAAEGRVDVALEFPPKAVKIHWLGCGDFYTFLGILGRFRNQQGSLVSRFSDDASSERAFSRVTCADDERPFGSLRAWHIPNGYEEQIYLPSGQYDLQIVLGDKSKYGKLEIPVSIPAYGQQELLLSSIAVCKRYLDAARAAKEAVAANLAPQYMPLTSKGSQFTPAGNTRFRKGEPLIAYFEVYEPLLVPNPSAKVQVRLKITNQHSGEIKTDTGFRPADSWIEPGSSAIHIAENIARDQLTPGSYRLEVQASDSAGRSTNWQAASFSIE